MRVVVSDSTVSFGDEEVMARARGCTHPHYFAEGRGTGSRVKSRGQPNRVESQGGYFLDSLLARPTCLIARQLAK